MELVWKRPTASQSATCAPRGSQDRRCIPNGIPADRNASSPKRNCTTPPQPDEASQPYCSTSGHFGSLGGISAAGSCCNLVAIRLRADFGNCCIAYCSQTVAISAK